MSAVIGPAVSRLFTDGCLRLSRLREHLQKVHPSTTPRVVRMSAESTKPLAGSAAQAICAKLSVPILLPFPARGYSNRQQTAWKPTTPNCSVNTPPGIRRRLSVRWWIAMPDWFPRRPAADRQPGYRGGSHPGRIHRLGTEGRPDSRSGRALWAAIPSHAVCCFNPTSSLKLHYCWSVKRPPRALSPRGHRR